MQHHRRLAVLALFMASGVSAQPGRITIPGPPPELPISNRCEASTAPPLAGSMVIVDKFQATISVVDLPTGDLVAQIPVGHGPHELAVSPNGSRAMVCNYGFTSLSNSISIVDLEALTTLDTVEFDTTRRPHDVHWTPQRVLVTSEATNSVIEIDPETAAVMREYDVARPTAHMLALDSKRGVLFTANIIDSTVSRVELSGDEPGPPLVAKIGGAGEGISLTPDGSELWVTDGKNDLVHILDPDTLETVATIACPGRPHRVRFSEKLARGVVTCLETNEIAVIDVTKREVVASIANSPDAVIAIDPTLLGTPVGSCMPSAIRVHPDGRHALIANINSNTVTVIDLETHTALGVLRCGFGADGMAITARRYGQYARDDAGSD